MLQLLGGCSYLPCPRGQMQKQVKQFAQDAGMATPDIPREEAKPVPDIRLESEANGLAVTVQHAPKLNALRRSNRKTAEFLIQLETENAELRHQAVELALQIQKLVESQLR
jgi:hypothetical protein